MTLLNRQVLLDTGANSSTGNWYPLDWRNDPGGTVRTFTGTLTSGDTVYFELTNQPVFNQDGSAATITVISTVSAFTDTNFSAAFIGQYSAIRFRKTGTNGAAVVYGIV